MKIRLDEVGRVAWILTIALTLLGMASNPASADTATIDFNCETGRLDFKASGAGDLVAVAGRGVFTGANITMLSDGSGGAETSGGIVTINMTGFNPLAVMDSGLSILVRDGTTTITATVIDLFDDDLPDVVLTDQSSFDGAEFLLPNASNNFMTLTYNPTTDTATVTIQGSGGNTATITDVNLGPVQMGVQAANNQANFDNVTFTGTDVPLFPPLIDQMNLWVDFSETCGNGAQTYPFGLLSEAVAEADPGALVSIVPGMNSSESFAGGSAINLAMTLVNSDPGSGSVSVGAIARRGVGKGQSTSGFVSRHR